MFSAGAEYCLGGFNTIMCFNTEILILNPGDFCFSHCFRMQLQIVLGPCVKETERD